MLSHDLANRLSELVLSTVERPIDDRHIMAALSASEEYLIQLQQKVVQGDVEPRRFAQAKLDIQSHFINIQRRIDCTAQQEQAIQVLLVKYPPFEPIEIGRYKFSHDWFDWNIEQWEQDYGYLRGRSKLRFLEIGCFEGRSTCWLINNILTHESSTITCVDPFVEHNKQEAIFDYNILQTGCNFKVFKFRGYSYQVIPFLPAYSYHFVYIDGSHRVKDILHDAMASWELVSPQGIIVFDDYESVTQDEYVSPRLAIDMFLSLFKGKYEIIHKDYQIGLRKCAD